MNKYDLVNMMTVINRAAGNIHTNRQTGSSNNKFVTG